MKKDIQIKVSTETNQVLINSEILGISSENLQGNIIFKPEPFINGTCRLYVEGLGVIEMDKQEDCYTLPIKSSLLKSPGIDICFKIIEPTNEEGTPIFATKIIHLKVLDTIEDDSEIPEQYPTWIETFDSKIAEIDDKLEEADSAISNIQDLTSEYNQNAVNKTNDFNTNVTNQISIFDNHVTSKTEEFDADTDDIVGTKKAELDDYEETKENELDTYTNSLKNDLDTYESSKETELNIYTTTKKAELDTHTNNKKTELDTYEQSKEAELDTYANGLKDTFNTNATNKTSEFDQNAEDKTDDFDDNASAKTTAFNNNATEKIAEYDAHVSELQSQITDLETLVETELESNEVEGTEIDVSDSAEYPGKIIPGANLEQEQLDGNQLIDFNNGMPNKEDVTYTFSNDVLTLTGNNTGYSYVILPITELYKSNPGKVLKFVYDTINVDNQFHIIAQILIEYNDVASKKYVTLLKHNLENFIHTIPNDVSNIKKAELQIYSNNTSTAQNSSVTITKPMLQFGTENKDYEPYCGGQASPNPDYPQEIKVVTGDNVIRHVGKNEFYGEKFGLLWWNSSTGNFTNSGNFKSFICRVKTNTQYVISKKNVSNRFIILTSQNEPAAGKPYKRALLTEVDSQRTSYSFTTQSDENYIFFGLYSGTDEIEIAKAIEEIQLEEGTTPSPYEPYREEEYKLDLWKENEFDSESATIVNALLNDAGLLRSSNYYRTAIISVLSNKTYKISKMAGLFFRVAEFASFPQLEDSYNNRIKDDNAEYITYKTAHSTNYLAITYWSSADAIGETEMLNSIQIQEAIELCKIGDNEDIPFKNVVGDENYNSSLTEGAWYKKEIINKRTLNSSEIAIANNDSYDNITYASFGKDSNDYVYNTFSNKKAFSNVMIYDNSSFSPGWDNSEKIGFLFSNATSKYYWYGVEKGTSLEQIQSKLNGALLYTVRATAKYTQITNPTLISQLEALRKAKWYKGVNHWWTETANLEPNLKGTYKQSNNLRLQALEQAVVALGGV